MGDKNSLEHNRPPSSPTGEGQQVSSLATTTNSTRIRFKGRCLVTNHSQNEQAMNSWHYKARNKNDSKGDPS